VTEAPHLGRSVLEIGSGIGTYSSRIASDPKVERLASSRLNAFRRGVVASKL